MIDAPSPALKFQAASVRLRILGLLTVLSFVNYLLRNNLSVAQPSIQSEFHFTNTEFGWILFGFNIAYTAFQVPGGLFGEWLGPRRSLALIAIAWGVLTVLTGLAPGLLWSSASAALWGLTVVRFLLGVANAPLFPIIAATFANWFPVANWAFPNAVTNAGLTLAQAALGPVVTTLIVYCGWRESFYVLAPVGFAIGAWWWWYSRDTPREHPSVTPAELRLIEGGREPSHTTATSAAATLKVMLERDVLVLAASYFCMNVVFYMFAQWLFAYLVEERGFAVLTSGWLYALPFAAGAVMAIVGGAACDVLCRRIGPRWGCRLPGALGMVLVALLLLAGVRAANPYFAVALLSLCFAFTQFADSSYWQATIFVAGPRTAAACGVLNTGGNLPGLLAPLVGYVIDQFGWLPAFASGTVFALIGAGLWLFVRVVPQSHRQPHGVAA
jgi:ACS family glucarate transporter-like MFS transporter